MKRVARRGALLLLTLAGAVEAQAPRSETIARFERELERNGPAATGAFERQLRNAGTPLVEAIAGAPDSVLVTFVWFADEDHDNVVVQSWLESRDVERRAMRRIGDSRVWYISFAAPAGLTMGYLISPDDPRLSDDEPDFDRMVSGWRTDPLNPRKAPGALGIAWSLIDLGDAPSSEWLADGPEVPPARLPSDSIASEALGATVPVRVYLPPAFDEQAGAGYPLLMFFDGYGFFDIDEVHRLAEQMIAAGDIEPVVIAFVYNPDATRNRDMSCHAPTHAFLADELLPLMRGRYAAGRTADRTIIAGRSRSALGAACAAYRMPGQIGNVLSQSGAFWWAPDGQEYEWLAREISRSARLPISFYLDAGLLENGPNPETGLSMLTVTRHLRDVLVSRGYRIRYHEYAGGHDPIGWRTALPGALRWFLGR